MANPIFGRGERFNLNHPAHPGREYAAESQQVYPQAGAQYPGGARTAPNPYEQQNPYAQQPYGANQYGGNPYGSQPSGYAMPPQGGPYATAPQYQQQASTGGVMTYDDVIAKTGISLLLVVAAAAAAWFLVPPEAVAGLLLVSVIVSFVTVIVVSIRKQVGPVALAIYALGEGAFLGALTNLMETIYPGIAFSAVLATFVVAGATLAFMKVTKFRTSAKFRQMVMIGTWSMAGLFLINLVLYLFGINLGIRDFGGDAGIVSIIVSVIALALAVFNLVMDFDAVRVGVENRAPARESWRAAFGITVTLVWLYIEILRFLSYFRD
ncbi:Bax inhibitor-1/YccA family protein [uncultured Tessaracoccus sp.]|uniref:Bax inhibitor-1/YccA family membrane protein n=1 Tax=uncultured Tessaracoccus sp. TaxID=905023 RepID=UPI0025F680C1|nr:Bax inhibitor-1/YccA family protein [uncultured Tessaracoccus sp.]